MVQYKYTNTKANEVNIMELNIVKIIKKIDKLRKKLNNLVDSDRQLTDKKVVDCSQKLDKLLTEYEKIKKELKSKDAA